MRYVISLGENRRTFAELADAVSARYDAYRRLVEMLRRAVDTELYDSQIGFALEIQALLNELGESA